MRIVWKDSNPIIYNPVRYKEHTITRVPNGWTTDIPSDDNLYTTRKQAISAIDTFCDRNARRGASKKRADSTPQKEKTEKKKYDPKGRIW